MGRTHKPLDQLDPGSVSQHKGRILDRLNSPKGMGYLSMAIFPEPHVTFLSESSGSNG